MNNNKGFTLIELMIVVAIIGILAGIALPSYRDYINRAKVTEALSLGSFAKEHVTDYYREQFAFPDNNAESGLPSADKLIGNRVTNIAVDQGAVHVTMGNKAPKILHGKILTLRPAVVVGSPKSPISWLCGYDVPVPGMKAVGENRTDIDNKFLPASCRAKRPKSPQ